MLHVNSKKWVVDMLQDTYLHKECLKTQKHILQYNKNKIKIIYMIYYHIY